MSWVAERILARIDKAAQDNASPLSMLEAAFMAHIDFVTKHPGVPRLLFGELQRAGDTLPKRMVQMLIHQYRERLQRWFSQRHGLRRAFPKLDTQAAAVLLLAASKAWSCSPCWPTTPTHHAKRSSRLAYLPSRSDRRQPCLNTAPHPLAHRRFSAHRSAVYFTRYKAQAPSLLSKSRSRKSASAASALRSLA